MKTYVVELRWTNPNKYLIDAWKFNDFMLALRRAKEVASKLDSDHFVEIRVLDETN